jgi:fatty-acid desaturase
VTGKTAPTVPRQARRAPGDVWTRLTLGFAIDSLGNRRRVAWINVIAIGLLLPGFSLWAIYRVLTTPTGLVLWMLTAGLYVFTLVGVTMGNHRYWTHRGYEARLPLQIVLAIASVMSLEDSIQQAASNSGC